MTFQMRYLALLPLSLGVVLGAQTQTADLVVFNARIFTGVPGRPWAEALSIRGDRVALVGSNAEVGKEAGFTTRMVDAAGRLVIPGINDAHAHPTALPAHTRVEGPPAVAEDPTLDTVIARLKSAVARAPAGGWVLGEIGGNVLQDPKATRAALDPISGDHPILLGSWHGHGTLLNTEAMRRLKVREREPDPPGGFYGRMRDGETVTGLAHEYADYIVRLRLAMLADRTEQVREYQRYAVEAAGYGITSNQAMMTGYPAEQAIPLMIEANLPIRMRIIDFPMTAMSAWRQPLPHRSTGLVTVSGTKWILDGTPIERLMFIRQPFDDAPSSRGRLNFPDADLRAFLARALGAREQPMFHAVGDAAIDTLLAALEATGGERWTPLRPRIEHGDMFEPAHADRAKRMGVIVVQNPSHFMLGSVMRARVGARTARMAAVKSIVASSVPLAIGSDGPMNPFLNLMFATINETNPQEALTLEQALSAYTRGSAHAEMLEAQKGTLAPGMLADLAMLSQDIFKVPPPDLPKTTSVLTIVGGRIVHESKR
jgi:predicted amidohydrolase YtcJ